MAGLNSRHSLLQEAPEAHRGLQTGPGEQAGQLSGNIKHFASLGQLCWYRCHTDLRNHAAGGAGGSGVGGGAGGAGEIQLLVTSSLHAATTACTMTHISADSSLAGGTGGISG